MRRSNGLLLGDFFAFPDYFADPWKVVTGTRELLNFSDDVQMKRIRIRIPKVAFEPDDKIRFCMENAIRDTRRWAIKVMAVPCGIFAGKVKIRQTAERRRSGPLPPLVKIRFLINCHSFVCISCIEMGVECHCAFSAFSASSFPSTAF